MKKIIGIIFLVALPFLILSGCTTHEGAAYIKKDLNNMTCARKSVQTNIDIEKAKADCIKDVVDEEFFKDGASIMVVEHMRDVNRWKYSGCMADKGFFCTWGPENR